MKYLYLLYEQHQGYGCNWGRVLHLCEADPQTFELHIDHLVFALGTQPRNELFGVLKDRLKKFI